MKKVGLVVLNYKKYDETIACVESALLQSGVELSIVIVDNGSMNQSEKILREHFSKYPNVEIIALEENMGYAKGNNEGIRKLRQKGIEYICVANSDVMFSTLTILHQMVESDEKSVGIILPIIKNPDGTLDQRVAYKKKFISLRMIKAIIERQPCFNSILCGRSTKKNTDFLINELRAGIQKEAYVVTGSIFILTPMFFENYSQLFPETFLYFEEWATIIYLYKAKLNSKIVDTDTVIHKGGASTPQNIKAVLGLKKRMMAESGRKVLRLVFMSSKGIEKKYGSKNRGTDKCQSV